MTTNNINNSEINEDSNLNNIINSFVGDNESENTCITLNSKYYDIDDIPESFSNCDKYAYKVLHLNIHSLPAKFEALKLMLASLQQKGIQFDFILICESFLQEKNVNLYNLENFKFISKNRSKLKGGGVCMYIQNDIQFKLRDDIAIFREGEFESIFIETSYPNNKPSIIGEVYRVPNTNTKKSLEYYESIIAKIGNTNTIIGTDQNFDFLKIDSCTQASELLNTYLASSLIPTITKPTRITHSTATLIDNILIKYNPNSTTHSGIIISDISDHMPVFCFIDHFNKK